MQIVNPHGTERSRAIQQDYALQSFRNALEREYKPFTVSDLLLELGVEDRENLETELQDKAERRHSWFSNMYRKYLRSLETRQAIRSNIDKYVTVLFIAAVAVIIITHVGLYGAPAFLSIGVPLSTGAM